MRVLDKAGLCTEAKLKVIDVPINKNLIVKVSEIPQDVYEAINDDPENQTVDEEGKKNPHWFRIMTGLIIASVVNEDGTPMFTAEDKATVAGFSKEIRGKITDACLKANGFNQDEKKPSEPIQDGSTTSE